MSGYILEIKTEDENVCPELYFADAVDDSDFEENRKFTSFSSNSHNLKNDGNSMLHTEEEMVVSCNESFSAGKVR